MLEKISEDIKNAMRQKNKEKLECLRFLKSSLLKNKTDKKPQDEQTVVITHCKRLKDSLESYPENSDERNKILKELEYLQEYLPQPLSEEDVKELIEKTISEMDAPQFGLIMKEISQKIKGKFDGKRASELVKEKLN